MLRVGSGSDVSRCQFDVADGGRVVVGSNCVLRGRVVVGDGCAVTIGDGTVFNRSCFVRAWERTSVTIGAGCLFSDVTVETSDLHSVIDVESGIRLNPAKNVAVADRCWVGSGALLLGGCVLSTDTVVGAKAVVTSQFPPNTVVAGVPARVVKEGVRWSRERL